MSNQAFNPEEYRMPLMAHLKELRYRLIVSIAAGIIGCVLCFAYVEPIWEFLVAPMNDALMATQRGDLVITDPLEGFMTELKVAAVAGVGLASPIIFFQIWQFIAPGLYPEEQRFITPLAFFSTLLFLAGITFGYSVIFRFAFPFFLEVTPEGVDAMLSINRYLALATRLLVAFGICFQLPIVAFALARVGLIDHKDMIGGFRYSVVGIFIVSAIITPPDVISQVLMATPLIFLYGIGIIIAWLFTTKKREDVHAES
ncbi:MAG: twin-arginine translocase subunit TatC [Myxococcota bacterium]